MLRMHTPLIAVPCRIRQSDGAREFEKCHAWRDRRVSLWFQEEDAPHFPADIAPSNTAIAGAAQASQRVGV